MVEAIVGRLGAGLGLGGWFEDPKRIVIQFQDGEIRFAPCLVAEPSIGMNHPSGGNFIVECMHPIEPNPTPETPHLVLNRSRCHGTTGVPEVNLKIVPNHDAESVIIAFADKPESLTIECGGTHRVLDRKGGDSTGHLYRLGIPVASQWSSDPGAGERRIAPD